jgi:hypothetical protein
VITTVQIKNEQLHGLVNAINQLLTMPVSVRVGMRLRAMARALEGQHKDVEDVRRELVIKHAQRGEDGEMIYLDTNQTQVKVSEGLEPEWNELMDLTFECPTIQASLLDGLNVTGLLLLGLGDALVDDLGE